MKNLSLLLALLTFTMMSCGGSEKTPELSQADVDRTKQEMTDRMEREKTVFGNDVYKVTSFSFNGTPITLAAEHEMTVNFFGPRIVAGNCRNFRGQFDVKGDQNIEFSGLTYMKPTADEGCPINQVEIETQLYDSFAATTAFSIAKNDEGQNTKITLSSEKSEIVLEK